MHYLIVYFYESVGLGMIREQCFGNVTIKAENKIKTNEHIRQLEERIEKDTGEDGVIIVNIIELGE